MTMQSEQGNVQPVRAEKTEGLILSQSAALGPNPYFPPTPQPNPADAGLPGSADNAETGADGDAGSSADHQITGDGGETFLEAEGVDTNSPEYKKLFASYTRQRQKDRSEVSTLKEDFARQLNELRAQIATPTQQVPPKAETEATNDLYGLRVDRYAKYQFKPESSLYGMDDDIREATLHYVREAVRDIREQSEAVQFQQQQQTTRQKLEGFVAKVPQDKYQQAEALFREHAQVAVTSPEAFIRLATYELGLNEQAPIADESNVVSPQRLADKRRAAVPRPSQSATTSSTKPFQAKSIAEAIDYACRVHGVSR